MKFLCVKCDEQMKLKSTESSEENSVTIVFACQQCGSEVAMLTNPMESQLVKGLGVHVGGRTTCAMPMEVIQGALMTEDKAKSSGIPWDEEAEKRFANIPSFVQPMARAGIERYAMERGYDKITSAVMAEARELYGM
jgi:dissimilatory sulfite reductase (desulfoviridin) alpha/beta subunit